MKSGVARDNHAEMIESPFDYPRLGKVVVPDGAIEAGSGYEYNDQITDLIAEHLQDDGDVKDSALVLFTNRRLMNDVRDKLPYVVRKHVMTQDEYSKQEVIRQHKEKIDQDKNSVLFGLASFAEGIDLPGEFLQHVIIVRLPFSVPDDPVDATLAEWLESKGRNPFMEISVPDASVRLIQACGRLIRTRNRYRQNHHFRQANCDKTLWPSIARCLATVQSRFSGLNHWYCLAKSPLFTPQSPVNRGKRP